ncbi:MAG: hypothetical protein ABJL33_15405 [Hyphomicrobiales bacterium]
MNTANRTDEEEDRHTASIGKIIGAVSFFADANPKTMMQLLIESYACLCATHEVEFEDAHAALTNAQLQFSHIGTHPAKPPLSIVGR